MQVPCNLGPFVRPLANGGMIRFAPTYAPEAQGALILPNPLDYLAGPGYEVYAARLFVGLNRRGVPTFTPRNVIDFVKTHWRGGASFITQRGIWFDGTHAAEEEDSLQIVILNVGTGRTHNQFVQEIGVLAQELQRAFDQDTVYAEIQANGLSVGMFSASRDVPAQAASRGRAKRGTPAPRPPARKAVAPPRRRKR